MVSLAGGIETWGCNQACRATSQADAPAQKTVHTIVEQIVDTATNILWCGNLDGIITKTHFSPLLDIEVLIFCHNLYK